MSTDLGLVYVGKVIEISTIETADFIVSATVVCGKGGKWKGVVKKDQFQVGSLCIVFLPDALIPEREDMRFLEKDNWRVKMKRFRGAPSEVVIMPIEMLTPCLFDRTVDIGVGFDCTLLFKVTKYSKPVPANLQGKVIGEFPSFIPKTDEPNYQLVPDLVEMLNVKPFYITEKADGSSTTAFRYRDKFGVCSRNWELEKDEKNGYWEVVLRYNLEELIPEGIALQWETCGPKIQKNPMGLQRIEGFAFSGYNIIEKRYLSLHGLTNLCKLLHFPMCKVVRMGTSFSKEGVELLGEGKYDNGKEREGVVVRSQENIFGHKPISFKVINLNYEI